MPDSIKRPLKVFLCHASADKPAVRKLYRYLRTKGMDPWLDAEKLLPGEHWEVEIPKALFASDVILVCLSRNSVNKEGYVQKEIAFALDKALEKPDGTIFIVPAKLEECEVPYRLSRYHWVDLFRDDGRKRLMLSLNKRAEQLGPNIEQAVVSEKTVEQEAKEKVARERAEYEAAEQAVREKAEREELEKKEREKLAQETQERLAKEIAEQETRARSEREAREKIVREQAERDAAEKAAQEKAEREKAQVDAEDKANREKTEREVTSVGPVYDESIPKIPALSRQPPKKLRSWGIGLMILTALAVVVWSVLASLMSPKATQTPFASQTITTQPVRETSISETDPATDRPSVTRTSVPLTPTPSLEVGSTMIGEDGMTLLYVPAGEFTMGSTLKQCENCDWDNKPAHLVNLDAFWMDQTEVTNKQYAVCVSDGKCELPLTLESPTRSSYYGDPRFDNYPVVYVEWHMAAAYCEWAGRRLPTEAEWEKAARSEDERIYPWGNDPPNDNLLNYNSSMRDSVEVGKYPEGHSPYGVYDMAGNVWEWVSDWYDSSYYQTSPRSNPAGPETGEIRTLRGGSWYFEEDSAASIFRYGAVPVDYLVRSDVRSFALPSYEDTTIYGRQRFGIVGFRCAMSAAP